MKNRTFYNEILTEHNMNPYHKHPLVNPMKWMRGVNPSCGDDIVLQLNVEDGVITDGAFVGNGCAISQASADMMLDLVIGRTREEAIELKDLFLKMIREEITEEELERLEEASSLKDISHMPSRVKCAVLGWHTLEEILKEDSNGGETTTESDGDNTAY
ncbi:MAG: SUF system NifU family Fe-S cluster assembly protein [Lachnospiraceae bacterium]|nr:SUF system NifU family Fe-S cluster assembly protein [Lachnospiraceae bacterium]